MQDSSFINKFRILCIRAIISGVAAGVMGAINPPFFAKVEDKISLKSMRK